MKKILLLILVLIGRAGLSQSLDASFGVNGKISYALGLEISYIKKVIALSEGQILTGGVLQDDGNYQLFVHRMNTDGSLDNSFSSDGMFTKELFNSNTFLIDMGMDSDGKIVVAGYYGDPSKAFLLRLTSSGELDNTFGMGGVFLVPNTYDKSRIHAIHIQIDGKILLTGYESRNNNQNIMIGRLNSNGTLDNSFDQDGIKSIDLINSSGIEQSGGIGVLNDGSIVIAVVVSNYVQDSAIVIKLTSTGAFDNSFGQNGMVSFQQGSYEQFRKILIHGDKLVFCGFDYFLGKYHSIAIRLLSDGTYDNTFANQGIYSEDLTDGAGDGSFFGDILLLPDDNYLIGGTLMNNDFMGDMCMLRLSSNGTPDNNFGTDGLVTLQWSALQDDAVNSITLQQDNKIIIAGNNGRNIAMARYESITLDNLPGTDILNEFSYSPNPVADNCNVSFTLNQSSEVEIKLIGNNGALIQMIKNKEVLQNGNYTVVIDLSKFTSGLYAIVLETSTGRDLLKICKE